MIILKEQHTAAVSRWQDVATMAQKSQQHHEITHRLIQAHQKRVSTITASTATHSKGNETGKTNGKNGKINEQQHGEGDVCYRASMTTKDILFMKKELHNVQDENIVLQAKLKISLQINDELKDTSNNVIKDMVNTKIKIIIALLRFFNVTNIYYFDSFFFLFFLYYKIIFFKHTAQFRI